MEVGGGQLHTATRRPEGLISVRDLSKAPFRCVINDRSFEFGVIDYREPAAKGECGLCDSFGFRLTVDGAVVWEARSPRARGDRLGAPVFNGTVDPNFREIEICEHHYPDAVPSDLAQFPDLGAKVLRLRPGTVACGVISVPAPP